MVKALAKINELKSEFKIHDKTVASILGASDVSIRRWRLKNYTPEWVEKSIDNFRLLSKKKQTEIVNDAK